MTRYGMALPVDDRRKVAECFDSYRGKAAADVFTRLARPICIFSSGRLRRASRLILVYEMPSGAARKAFFALARSLKKSKGS